MFNPDFYPTPKPLIEKMWQLVDRRRIANILEPSAGKGDILDYIKDLNSFSHYRYNYSAIEKEFELRATLKGKGYKVLDSDFLAYSGLDRFDLIIANPPFSQGEHHLLKALSMMDSGQIVFLLNAETLKNPCTNARKELVNKLDKHKAKIEFIKDAFIDAERKTRVEIALIYIDLGEPSSSGMFDNCTDKTEESDIEEEEETAVASKNTASFGD